MTTFIEYGDIKKANAALEAIKNGGIFNGTVYAKNHSNGVNADLSVYVSGQLFPLGRVGTKKVDILKAEFLAAASAVNVGKTSTKYVDETKVFGTEAWLHSGMNAE